MVVVPQNDGEVNFGFPVYVDYGDMIYLKQNFKT
jgi:hypothetical protein